MNEEERFWMCERGHRIVSSTRPDVCPAPLTPDGRPAVMGGGEPCGAEIEWQLVDPDGAVANPDRVAEAILARLAHLEPPILPVSLELVEDEPIIEVHRFEDCSRDWQDLSTNGGDEDWIVVFNSGSYDEYWPEWVATSLDSMREPQRVVLPDRRTAWICSHA